MNASETERGEQMPDWFVQGKDWFIGPEAFVVLLGIGLVSGVVFCSVRWALDKFSRKKENATEG